MLVGRAEAALKHAYAPYSNFQVAAAVLLDNGVVVTGSNQENAAYPAGMCAERVALFAVSSQFPGAAIRKMVVVARKGGTSRFTPATSCGSCRQVMLEFESRQDHPFEVVMLREPETWIRVPSAGSLLPFSFNKSNLNES